MLEQPIIWQEWAFAAEAAEVESRKQREASERRRANLNKK